MHHNELIINNSTVKALIKTQCPQWKNLPLELVSSSGTEHTLFRMGNDYIIRLPRVEWTSGNVNKNVEKEFKWIPQISNFLKIPISKPVFKGHSDQNYPWSWTIIKWNDGQTPNFEKENEYTLLAQDVAYFLNDLHKIKLSGPVSRRGIQLKELDTETTKAISKLNGEIDTKYVTNLWNKLSNTPVWSNSPTWLHGDLLPGNILVKNNRLSAVIDFSDVGVGVILPVI